MYEILTNSQHYLTTQTLLNIGLSIHTPIQLVLVVFKQPGLCVGALNYQSLFCWASISIIEGYPQGPPGVDLYKRKNRSICLTYVHRIYSNRKYKCFMSHCFGLYVLFLHNRELTKVTKGICLTNVMIYHDTVHFINIFVIGNYVNWCQKRIIKCNNEWK